MERALTIVAVCSFITILLAMPRILDASDRVRTQRWNRRWDKASDAGRLDLLEWMWLPADVERHILEDPQSSVRECREHGLAPQQLHRFRLERELVLRGIAIPPGASTRELTELVDGPWSQQKVSPPPSCSRGEDSPGGA